MADYGGFAFIDKEKLWKQLRRITCKLVTKEDMKKKKQGKIYWM